MELVDEGLDAALSEAATVSDQQLDATRFASRSVISLPPASPSPSARRAADAASRG